MNNLPHFGAAPRKSLRELRSICGIRTLLPTSHIISSDLVIEPQPFDAGGFGDVYKGSLDGSQICIKRVRVYSQHNPAETAKVRLDTIDLFPLTDGPQTFYREAVVWKYLNHPNIVPLLGTTISPFQFISKWMSGGDLLSYIKNPNVDRLALVCADFVSFIPL